VNLIKDNIPWPDSLQFRKPSSRPDVQEIEWATAREHYEQDLWRERLERLESLDLPGNAIEVMERMGFDVLCERMEAERATYPPTHTQRAGWYEYAGEEWHRSMCPNYRKTDEVNDEKLRYALYELIEIGEHKERIKSSVLLPSILKVSPEHEETNRVFAMWRAITVAIQLEKEFPMPEPKK
jgi:hypothetical protein